MKWTVADDKSYKEIYLCFSPLWNIIKIWKADGTDGKTEVTPVTAENIKTVKYAVIQNGSYQNLWQVPYFELDIRQMLIVSLQYSR